MLTPAQRWLHGLILFGVPFLLSWYAFTFSHTQLLPEAVLPLQQVLLLETAQDTPPPLEAP
ncbi:MAG: hypothetical protein KDK05_07020, partial [Candidatus Competibacteraceae bacterium]|nr:hypothetical protein [Candidatus Competibacteraceae bacterium]